MNIIMHFAVMTKVLYYQLKWHLLIWLQPADLHEYNMAEQAEHKYSTLYAYVQNDAKDEDRVW